MGLEGRSDKEEAQQSWGQEWEDLVVFYSEYIETVWEVFDQRRDVI